MIRIGIIENNYLLREGISMCLNDHPKMEVKFGFNSIQKLVDCGILNELNFLIFDTDQDNDFIIIRQLQADFPKLKLIILSALNRLVENYLFYENSPTSAFLTKEIKMENLISTILNIHTNGKMQFVDQNSLRTVVSNKMDMKNSFFTERECTILNLISKGKTNKETSEILNLSFRTIESHRRKMIEKLGCTNIIPVILYGIEKKYINIEPDKDWFWNE